jgi:hypothetical protein
MSLDGLRAWIGEVERKLGVRSRVFLVLSAIAIGAGGAGIYLALDARDSAVTESELQRVQDELEAQLGVGATTGEDPEMARLEAELQALRDEVGQLRGDGATQAPGTAPDVSPATPPDDPSASPPDGTSGSGEEEGSGTGAAGETVVPGAGATEAGATKLKELAEEGRDDTR